MTVNLKTGAQHLPENLAINRYAQVPVLRHRGLYRRAIECDPGLSRPQHRRFRGRNRTAALASPRMAFLGGRRHRVMWHACAISADSRSVDPAVMAHFHPLAETALTFIDRTLQDRTWLVGEACSIADIGCWGRMVFMAEGGLNIARWPSLEAWANRLRPCRVLHCLTI